MTRDKVTEMMIVWYHQFYGIIYVPHMIHSHGVGTARSSLMNFILTLAMYIYIHTCHVYVYRRKSEIGECYLKCIGVHER